MDIVEAHYGDKNANWETWSLQVPSLPVTSEIGEQADLYSVPKWDTHGEFCWRIPMVTNKGFLVVVLTSTTAQNGVLIYMDILEVTPSQSKIAMTN